MSSVQFNHAIPAHDLSDAPHLPDDPPLLEMERSGSKRRDERKLELCECMIDVAAAIFNVSGKDIRRSGRMNMSVTRVRQIAMYVAHVVLGLSMSDIGRGFGRDRTTVMHACHLIEDMRDDSEFDRIVVMVECVALAAFRSREGA